MTSITVDRSSSIPICTVNEIRVNTRGPMVGMSLDGAAIEITTTQAIDAGMKIVKFSDTLLPNESVLVTINGTALYLMPSHARSIGGALLRKADDADDFQLLK